MLIDAAAIATWKVPSGMTSHVHFLEAREGGRFRVSLTYNVPKGAGKTTTHTDTYHGRFVKLVPGEQVVEVVEFETTDPALRGEMTITITLTPANGGTDVLAVHDGLPSGSMSAASRASFAPPFCSACRFRPTRGGGRNIVRDEQGREAMYTPKE